MQREFRGLGASSGIALGPALVWRPVQPASAAVRAAGSPEEETVRLQAARQAAEEELAELRDRAEREMGGEEAAIFSAHLLMLSDPALMGEAEELVRQGLSAEAAVEQATERQAALLAALPDAYLAERAADVRDVGGRLLAHLQDRRRPEPRLEQPAVVVARDLTPSQTARLPKDLLLGIVTEAGGPTSHVAIMARALGIPVVVGVPGIVDATNSGDVVALDGDTGEVVVRPADEELARWRRRQELLEADRRRLAGLASRPAVTADGHPVSLLANISTPADVARALEMGAQGVGLFRTEFLYMDRDDAPGEDEQYLAYREVIERCAPHPVTIRTLDVGGDKQLPYLGLKREMNPFLGWRALRYCLDAPDVFRTQLRALLRAAAGGPGEAARVGIMFPFVVSLEEIRRAKAQVELARRELEARGAPHAGPVKIGIMVETPAAALMAERLAREVDFFSIGSNDLTQYTLAADRHNEHVAQIFDELHPAVLRLIEATIRAADRAGIEVSLCGELAGDARAAPLLLGLGLRKFSAAAPSLPRLKEKISATTLEEARGLARRALQAASAEEVRALLSGHDGE